jgi:hypothetical protein
MEMAMHLTGRYPSGWRGRRFGHMIDAWAACDTGETTRDNPQRALLGPVAHWGTGAIPTDALGEVKRGRGVADLVDTVLVRHDPRLLAPRLQALRPRPRVLGSHRKARHLVRRGTARRHLWRSARPPRRHARHHLHNLHAT